jgi:hypothetical protein
VHQQFTFSADSDDDGEEFADEDIDKVLVLVEPPTNVGSAPSSVSFVISILIVG